MVTFNVAKDANYATLAILAMLAILASLTHRNATHNATVSCRFHGNCSVFRKRNATHNATRARKNPLGDPQGALCARDLNYACSAKAIILRS